MIILFISNRYNCTSSNSGYPNLLAESEVIWRKVNINYSISAIKILLKLTEIKKLLSLVFF